MVWRGRRSQALGIRRGWLILLEIIFHRIKFFPTLPSSRDYARTPPKRVWEGKYICLFFILYSSSILTFEF